MSRRRQRYAWDRLSRNLAFAAMAFVIVAFGHHAEAILEMFR